MKKISGAHLCPSARIGPWYGIYFKLLYNWKKYIWHPPASDLIQFVQFVIITASYFCISRKTSTGPSNNLYFRPSASTEDRLWHSRSAVRESADRLAAFSVISCMCVWIYWVYILIFLSNLRRCTFSRRWCTFNTSKEFYFVQLFISSESLLWKAMPHLLIAFTEL